MSVPTSFEITPFPRELIPQAAALFVENFKKQRKAVPALPDRMEDPNLLAEMLGKFLTGQPSVAAVMDGELMGYMGGYRIERFRGAAWKAAYCPEWGHAAVEMRKSGLTKSGIYRAMYRAMLAGWAGDGCRANAISVLAADTTALQVLFWSGFGMLVVDAVRPIQPFPAVPPTGLTIRKALPADAETLAELEAEHSRHYVAAPVFMVPSEASDAEEFTEFIRNPKNSAWLALDGSEPAGYMRFEGSSFGAAAFVGADTTVANTGAFVRPAYRGQKVAPTILSAALQDYASQGFLRCSVDFESINPEAAEFWPKYFEPVTYSLMRVPENLPG